VKKGRKSSTNPGQQRQWEEGATEVLAMNLDGKDVVEEGEDDTGCKARDGGVDKAQLLFKC
jgi:hypothetical protein